MNDLLGFASSSFSFSAPVSRSLSGMQPQPAAPSVAPDGSKFFTDHNGDIVYAQYASGAIVSRQQKQVAVRTADGEYWLGDYQGRWFRVD